MTAGTRVRRIVGSDHVVGWAFAFPAVFLIVLFGIVPIVWSAILSFQKTNLLAPPTGSASRTTRRSPAIPS